jgi:hypothetical protein
MLNDMLDALLNTADALLQPPFGPWLEIAGGLTVVMFVLTAIVRSAVDRALGGIESGRRPLGFFELSQGNAADAVKNRIPAAPERLWTYDEDYLDQFVGQAKVATVYGVSALDIYRKVVLPLDVIFGACLAAFVALFWLAVANLAGVGPAVGRFALFAQCMGILYAFADICEDVKLFFILADANHVDPAETAAANALTRMKFVAILFSVVGILAFGVLSAAYSVTTGLTGFAMWVERELRTILSALFERPRTEPRPGGLAPD